MSNGFSTAVTRAAKQEVELRITILAGSIVLAGFAWGIAPMAPPQVERNTGRPPRLRQVSVELLGRAEAIEGMEFRVRPDGEKGLYLRVEEPCEATIRLPGGRELRQVVKYLSVDVSHGVIVGANFTPQMRALPYKECLSELHRCFESLGITPDKRMREMLSYWPKPENAPNDIPRISSQVQRAAMDITEDTMIYVMMQRADVGGWFFDLSFDATTEARMGLRIPLPQQLAAPLKPTASEKPVDDDPLSSSATARKITVNLAGPVDDVSGVYLPTNAVQRRSATLDVFGPTDLSINLASGKTLRLAARYVVIRANAGFVLDVYALPFNRPVPFAEAKAELLRNLDALGITPSERMKQQMAEWPEDAPGFKGKIYPPTYITRTPIGQDGDRVEILIRPHPDGGWFPQLIFEANKEARRLASEASEKFVSERAQIAAGKRDIQPPP
jgi:hypothetical protein